MKIYEKIQLTISRYIYCQKQQIINGLVIIIPQQNNTPLIMKKDSQKDLPKRIQFLKNVKINVKSSQKTSDRDQLIVIETNNHTTKENVAIIMRKLSQLDYLVEYLDKEYGGHIIPFIKSDLYFQKNLQMQQLTPLISDYLNDLKHNKYCRQDSKVYNFIAEENMQFPKQMAYDKVLSSAAIFSRKYISSIFTRKEKPNLENTAQYYSSLNIVNDAISEYERVRQIAIILIQEHSLYEQSISLFAELSSSSCQATMPFDQPILFMKHSIVNCDKLILQCRQAHNRWENLVESVRELQGNVYKGLHEYQHSWTDQKKKLKDWCKSLSGEYWELSEYLTKKMEGIAGKIQKIKKDTIKQFIKEDPNQ